MLYHFEDLEIYTPCFFQHN